MSKLPVRAKFRVLEVVETGSWRGTSTIVKLVPVCAKQVDYVDGKRVESEHPENRMFWSYTPSGECSLTFPNQKAAADLGFVPSAYFYIDLTDPEEGDVDAGTSFKGYLGHVELWHGTQVGFTFSASRCNLHLKMSVQNPGAIPRMLDPFLATHAANRARVAVEGEVAKADADAWTILFTPAKVEERIVE